MGAKGLTIVEIHPDESADVETLLFQNFMAVLQTLRDGNSIEIRIRYKQPDSKKIEQPKLFLREKERK